jgi:hypothetical protein
MAKRRSSSALKVYRAPSFPRAAAPVIRISAPRSIAGPKKRHHRRSSSSSSDASGGKNALFAHAIGGAALGYAEKSGILAKVPQIPMLGAKGSFACIGYFLGFTKKKGIIRDAIMASAVLAGYEMGKDGKISGDDD